MTRKDLIATLIATGLSVTAFVCVAMFGWWMMATHTQSRNDIHDYIQAGEQCAKERVAAVKGNTPQSERLRLEELLLCGKLFPGTIPTDTILKQMVEVLRAR